MVFSGIPFLFYFLPCVLLVYFAVPEKFKNFVLLLSSLIFYAWGEPKYLILMLFSVTQGYFFALFIEKYRGKSLSKALMIISVSVSFALLIYCKYTDFFIGNFNAITGLSVPLLKIALPIGISFYTFQIASYTVDVYRGNAAAQHSYINLAAYVTMFPQLIAGPIVRYADIASQLDGRTHSAEKAAKGIWRFIIGLSKKVLFANTLSEICAAFGKASEASVLFFWLYAVSFTLQIYFDFSGYSDMAIGLGKIFGFDFSENFNYPYISGSITEFWRRWHISLGSWFRDYVYIPLGGNRVSKGRHIFNIFVVWMLTGFWHGAAWNFIFWGLFFAVLLTLEKNFFGNLLAKSKVISHIYVLLAVTVSFVIFDAPSMGDAFSCIRAMFGAGNIPFLSAEAVYYLRSNAVLLLAAAVGATPLPKRLILLLREKKSLSPVLGIAEPLVCASLFLVSAAFLVSGSFNPFLYFRF